MRDEGCEYFEREETHARGTRKTGPRVLMNRTCTIIAPGVYRQRVMYSRALRDYVVNGRIKGLYVIARVEARFVLKKGFHSPARVSVSGAP